MTGVHLCQVRFGSPFAWTFIEADRVHGVTIAGTTKEFYTASSPFINLWR